jgi:hypothetical protein
LNLVIHFVPDHGPLSVNIMAPSARGWQMIEIVTVLVALCFVSVVLRVVARLQRRVGFGIDDYLSVVSMVLMIAMLIELGLCELSFRGSYSCSFKLTVFRVLDRRQRGPR